jgi:hypothetical protein
MIFLCILKIVANLIFIKWGLMALKTFKPIIKDMNR